MASHAAWHSLGLARHADDNPRTLRILGLRSALRLRERVVPSLLGVAILVYITVIFLVSLWQLDTMRMGFDPLVYVQPLWNTLHGRIAAQSGSFGERENIVR